MAIFRVEKNKNYTVMSNLVEKETRRCITASDKTTFIAAGCEVPAETPEENLLLMNSLLYL